jgi:putative transposase
LDDAAFFHKTMGAVMSTVIEESKIGKEINSASRSTSKLPHASGHVPISGQAFLLTTTTIFKRPVFRDFNAARAAAAAHNMRWVWRDSQLLAWVLMPDQWHGLVALDQNDDLNQLMGRFKSATAKSMESRFKFNGWLWGRGFQEQALKQDVDLRDAGRHLITHPIRAGLVDEIGKYPYWNAVWVAAGNNSAAWPRSRA